MKVPHAIPVSSASPAPGIDCDVAGKSVLLVTSDSGVASLDALTRDAREVVVVDVDPERVRQAHEKAASQGLPAIFHCMNIEEQVPDGPFDAVLCLDVLQRVRNPMHVLDRLIAVCREKLVLDVPGPASAEAQRYLKEVEVPWWQRSVLARLPVVVVGRNGTTVTHPESKFYFSTGALRNLLAHQRRHFAEVRIEEVEAGRIRVNAARRARIQRLVVVAGPSACGKSSFIRRLERNEEPELSLRLGIDDISSWQVASSNHFPSGPAANRLIFHYDFLRPWRREARIFERDEALELLRLADEIVFVTVWTAPDQLRERVRDRIVGLLPTRDRLLRKKLQFLLRVLRRARPRRFSFSKARNLLSATRSYGADEMIHLEAQERIEGLYQTPDRVLDLYRRWFTFCGNFATQAHWVADTSWSDTQLIPLSDWMDRGNRLSTLADSYSAAGPRGETSEPSTSKGHERASLVEALLRVVRSDPASLTHIDFEGPSPSRLEISARRLRRGKPTRIRLSGPGLRVDLTLDGFMAGCGALVKAAAEAQAAPSVPERAGECFRARESKDQPRFGDVRLDRGGVARVYSGGDRSSAWTMGREDFFRFAEGCYRAVLRILDASGIDGRSFEPSFLGDIAWMAHEIARLEVQVVPLSDLRVIEYTREGWRPVAIPESLPLRYLQGDADSYLRYVKEHGSAHHTPENLESLKRSILEKGYPAGGHIVLFGDERYIRDGQHRAAVLFSLLGPHAEVPVLKVHFSRSFERWRMTKGQLSVAEKQDRTDITAPAHVNVQ